MASLALASLRPVASVRVSAGARTSRARVPAAARALTQRAAHAGSAPFASLQRARSTPAAGRASRSRLPAVTRAAEKSPEDSTASIAKKVQRTANACRTLGRWGFWGQLILATVSAVIVVFSVLFKNITKATDAGLYFILFGILCAYFTTFWSLGIGKLGAKLQAAVRAEMAALHEQRLAAALASAESDHGARLRAALAEAQAKHSEETARIEERAAAADSGLNCCARCWPCCNPVAWS